MSLLDLWYPPKIEPKGRFVKGIGLARRDPPAPKTEEQKALKRERNRRYREKKRAA